MTSAVDARGADDITTRRFCSRADFLALEHR
jgi:hypothetical protein